MLQLLLLLLLFVKGLDKLVINKYLWSYIFYFKFLSPFLSVLITICVLVASFNSNGNMDSTNTLHSPRLYYSNATSSQERTHIKDDIYKILDLGTFFIQVFLADII